MPEQCGGAKGKGTEIAFLFARTFLRWANASKTPAAIIFSDIKAAFDSTPREFCLGPITCARFFADALEKLPFDATKKACMHCATCGAAPVSLGGHASGIQPISPYT